MNRKFSWFNATSITLGFAFLYLPILLLVIYSFNKSKLVTVWAGFSTKWYAAVFQNESFLDAAFVTLRVGLVSATIATLLGIMASVILVRIKQFKGRTLFSGLINAPLVMPEVITGISLLLLFIAIGMPRGFWTITIAHITFSMCYACVVITSRLSTMDKSIEEAASDLGCTPLMSFTLVTLPNIIPAIASAWLLSFTLSLDDLVIASFTSGPSSTTLPMKIYSQVRQGVTPEINALSTLLIVAVTLVVITVSILSKRAQIKREKEESLALKFD